MEILQALILGLVQGASEFLPISSSGHLIIIPNILGWQGIVDSLSFDVALHLGTSLAVVAFFWKDWARLIGALVANASSGRKLVENQDSRLLLLIIVGSIPAAFAGFLLQDIIEEKFRSNLLIASTLIVFAVVLYLADRSGKRSENLNQLGFKDAVIVGFAQAISLIPGVSRSGITISAGLFQKLDRESATRFSFLLSTPAILGAAFLKSSEIVSGLTSSSQMVFIVGFFASAISGWLAIKLLLSFVKSNNFNVFVIYRIVLGLGILLFFR